MRKCYKFSYPTLNRALLEVGYKKWYVEMKENAQPADRARILAPLYATEPGVMSKPATIVKWWRRKSVGEDSPMMYVGELHLADGTVWPLAEVDPKLDRKLKGWNDKPREYDEEAWGRDL